jgi:hypothetical protein
VELSDRAAVAEAAATRCFSSLAVVIVSGERHRVSLRRLGRELARSAARAATRGGSRRASFRAGTTSVFKSRRPPSRPSGGVRKTVIAINGDVGQTFVVDGLVAGTLVARPGC